MRRGQREVEREERARGVPVSPTDDWGTGRDQQERKMKDQGDTNKTEI